MNQATGDLKAELEKSAQRLRTLRDEIKLKLHLAKLDAKDEWNRLEPKLESVLERAGRDITDATRTAVEDVTQAARKFRESLR